MPGEPDRVFLGLDFRNLSEAELHQFESQATELAVRFSERPGTGDILRLLAISAAEWSNENDGTLAGMGVSSMADPTAPLPHQVDDVGRVMAEAMLFVEDESLSPAVRGAWNDVLRNLASDVRRRQQRRPTVR